MSTNIFCVHLKKTAPKMSKRVYPGDLGDKIWQNISLEAWQLWLLKQTMLINENKLSVVDPNTKIILEKAMCEFLFEGKEIKISGYKDIEK